MFERAHHQRIARVLQALDAELLASHGCYFGGGTAIVLRRGEYRESVDIDFLVSRAEGYRALRQLLTGERGLAAIARAGHTLVAARPVRADQYGVRTAIRVDATEIKFEIVREARIELDTPSEADAVCGVTSLTELDLLASGLLANSDRWADDAVHNRDVIDMAMLAPGKPSLKQAIAKAQEAYGDAIERDLSKAITALRERTGRLEQCMHALQMHDITKAVLWQRIRALAPGKRGAG